MRVFYVFNIWRDSLLTNWINNWEVILSLNRHLDMLAMPYRLSH